jgi:hypothetical protein
MGFISNQWLNRGEGLRNRKYQPKLVAIRSLRPRDDWSARSGVLVEFEARKADGEYQTLHLSQAEVDETAGQLVAGMSPAARERLLVEALRQLSHAKLLRLLALDLRARVRLPK